MRTTTRKALGGGIAVAVLIAGLSAMPGAYAVDSITAAVTTDAIATIGTAYHPSAMVADSEETTAANDKAPVTNLLDNKTDGTPNTDTYWHTQYSGSTPAYPHGLVAKTDDKKVCGAVLTARSGKTSEAPKDIAFYYGDNAAPEMKKPQADKSWSGFTKIGDVVQLNNTGETVVKFSSEVSAQALAVGLFNGRDASKNYAHLADLRLIECKVTDPEPPAPEPASTTYHPTEVVWADSESTNDGAAPNGQKAALIDNGTDNQPNTATFWHSKWSGAADPLPHAIVVKQDQPYVCGVQLTPRSNKLMDFPKDITVYTRDKDQAGTYSTEAPVKPTVTGETKAWTGFTQVKAFTLAVPTTNAAQTVQFDAPVAAEQLGLALWSAQAASQNYMSMSDLSLVACEQVTLTFDVNGGMALAENQQTQQVTKAAPVGTLPVPTREAGADGTVYTFAGWNTAQAGGDETKVTQASTFSANATLYAQWTATKPVVKATVTLDANGGALPKDVANTYEVNLNSSIGQDLPVPTRETDADGATYVFAEWNTQQDGAGEVFTKDTVVTGNVTVYAKYTKTPKPAPVVVKVLLDANGGVFAEGTKTSFDVESGKSVSADLPVPTRKADADGATYTFTSWNTAKDGSGDVFTKDSVVSAATTVYAQWKVTPKPAPVVVLEVSDRTITAGDSLDLKALVSKATVDGADAAMSVTVDPEKIDTSVPGTYKVTFTLSAEGATPVVKTATVTVEKKAETPKPTPSASTTPSDSESPTPDTKKTDTKKTDKPAATKPAGKGKVALSETGSTVSGIAVGALVLLAAGGVLATRRRQR